MFQMDRLPELMAQGHLDAVAVTASSYTTGEHVTFYDSAHPIEPWARSQRLSVRDTLAVDHLMASSAIPFIFPAVRLKTAGGRRHYFGDGSMRQAAPISPAIHLGADRILVIGAGRLHEPDDVREGRLEYPPLAQIAGHAMSSIFLDALAVDIERMQRVNSTLRLLTPEQREQTLFLSVPHFFFSVQSLCSPAEDGDAGCQKQKSKKCKGPPCTPPWSQNFKILGCSDAFLSILPSNVLKAIAKSSSLRKRCP